MAATPMYPIVYVRGYAGTQGEVEDTVADPYMGFNAGSTKLRQKWTGEIDRHIFESPLVRLMKDYQYQDGYAEGTERTDKVSLKTVWIYRYYEPVSQDLGTGTRPEIETYASGLGTFLADIRDKTCSTAEEKENFKVFLVAHSMGGLVVRCWLQNLRQEENDPVKVHRVFTYATPHGGIDLRLIGNLPRWVQVNNTENFNETRMRDYLAIPASQSVQSLNDCFPAGDFFALVGTNARDYTVAAGLSSRAVGPMSDGLVQIKNATVREAPRAFVHRAHSGHYGIVNSEEGYQNLVRFFFGDVRVDGRLVVHDIPLPRKIEQARNEGKKIRASYHFEVVARVRGARWDLHRRTVDEQSAMHAKYEDIKQNHAFHLFSTFLSKGATRSGQYMTFSVDLGVLVPEYEIDNLIFDEHFEGSYIFRDTLTLGVAPGDEQFRVRYNWNSRRVNEATIQLDGQQTSEGWQCSIPVEKRGAPGITATLELMFNPH